MRIRPASSKPPPTRSLGRILVGRLAGHPSRGKLVLPGGIIPCALGRAGITHRKREGDGATPAGRFRIVDLWMRADRVAPIRTLLRRRSIRPGDGWCDDPGVPLYNRAIRLPSPASHERLWREDALYDLVLTLDYNLRRPRRGRGSAIFFHQARADWRPTAGCVAIRPEALRRLLPRLGVGSCLVIR